MPPACPRPDPPPPLLSRCQMPEVAAPGGGIELAVLARRRKSPGRGLGGLPAAGRGRPSGLCRGVRRRLRGRGACSGRRRRVSARRVCTSGPGAWGCRAERPRSLPSGRRPARAPAMPTRLPLRPCPALLFTHGAVVFAGSRILQPAHAWGHLGPWGGFWGWGGRARGGLEHFRGVPGQGPRGTQPRLQTRPLSPPRT